MDRIPENMKQLLGQYIDNELTAEQRMQVEGHISKDPGVREEFNALQLSVEAVRYSALSSQVASVHHEFLKHRQQTNKPATVHSIRRVAMRIAASVLLIMGAFGVFKYMAVDNASVYSEYYQSYELSRVRGGETIEIERAFSNKEWNKVISMSGNETNSKYLFLSGIAYMETGKLANAIQHFYR